jgi:hypothetical protein
MRIDKRLILIGLLLLITTMVLATQYAVTRVTYEYGIVHPSEANIRFIGSDNSSDGIRVLRTDKGNSSNITVTLRLGNFSTNTKKTYSAAFGIVNEEPYKINITSINITSMNITYLKIWLHGNRTANGESNLTDPTTLYMYCNGTMMFNASNTSMWTLAAGDRNFSSMCYNVSNRTFCTIPTPWDNTSHVRHSENNSLAQSDVSDYVWVQVQMDIPAYVDAMGPHSGIIWINFQSDTHI